MWHKRCIIFQHILLLIYVDLDVDEKATSNEFLNPCNGATRHLQYHAEDSSGTLLLEESLILSYRFVGHRGASSEHSISDRKPPY